MGTVRNMRARTLAFKKNSAWPQGPIVWKGLKEKRFLLLEKRKQEKGRAMTGHSPDIFHVLEVIPSENSENIVEINVNVPNQTRSRVCV